MAWTLVGNASGATKNTTATITLPGPPQPGDIVVITTGANGANYSSTRHVTTAGYTDIYTNNTPAVEVTWKVMGATPDTTVDIIGGSSARWIVANVSVWRTIDAGTPIDATPTGIEVASGSPNPPSYTTVTDGALRLIFGILDAKEDAANVTAPAGYGDLYAVDSASGGTTGITVMRASKEAATAGAEDPAAFGTALTGLWTAVHFALRPAASAPASKLFLGSAPIAAMYVGPSPVTKIYLGETQVWP